MNIGVVPDGGELDRVAVVEVLGRLFGDDEDLRDGVAAGEFAELLWDGERIRSQWFVQPGFTGVTELVVDMGDAFPRLPPEGYRAEAVRVVEILREVAVAAGGRLIVEEADMTDAPVGDVVDAIV